MTELEKKIVNGLPGCPVTWLTLLPYILSILQPKPLALSTNRSSCSFEVKVGIISLTAQVVTVYVASSMNIILIDLMFVSILLSYFVLRYILMMFSLLFLHFVILGVCMCQVKSNSSIIAHLKLTGALEIRLKCQNRQNLSS